MFGNIFGQGSSYGAQGAQQSAAPNGITPLHNMTAQQYNAAMQSAMDSRRAEQMAMLNREATYRNRKVFKIEVEVMDNGYMVDFGKARLIAKNLEELSQHVVSIIAAEQMGD